MKCSVFKIAFSVLILSAVSHLYSDSVHEVQTGDTLYSISKKYGVSVSAIQEANGFSDNGIKVGQKIKIPDATVSASATASVPAQTSKTVTASSNSPAVSASSSSAAAKASANSDGTYIVQKGETWFGISKKHGISVADLQKLNGVGSDAALKVGQKIKVPGGKNSVQTGTAIASTKTQPAPAKDSKTAKAPASQEKVPDLKANDPHNYSSKKADSSLVWPVKTENIVYINGKVGGVSMAAKKNEEVKAIRAGTVMFSGSYRGFGNVVFIQSKTGHIYAYTGLGSIDVSKGDYINYSSEIGTAGIDTYTGKSQISLMVFQNGQPIDPAKAPRG
ncbi:MAG: LysM peptidoglycan-binding domain-containing M23 family metallopeptidase [Treponema sp.]|uniref:LysM peptidoglycan-binding domain-containing M23 family metallopeptidase n=1 Tax=Treponema sp. TaxID=166 RepID=UPI002A91A8DB|nr:LysM peptidoglycan-binding domain-containing M23 family metallopeptidase [Treponema sp.]MDY6396346.1 LysM peptidoglycan-binding domain-containing M23 family metallopeptidase [Treponema sp.]